MNTNGLKTGFPVLDAWTDLSSGIFTMQSTDPQWMALLVNQMLVRNYVEGKKILLLQFLDYHERYWALDFDFIVKTAKSAGVPLRPFMHNTFVQRAFSRDTVENPEFWRRTLDFAHDVNLVILDSVGELYTPDKSKGSNSKPITYPLGKFRQICQQNDNCHAVALDYSDWSAHPFLGESSSAIIRFEVDRGVTAQILKHPCKKQKNFELQVVPQSTLNMWLR